MGALQCHRTHCVATIPCNCNHDITADNSACVVGSANLDFHGHTVDFTPVFSELPNIDSEVSRDEINMRLVNVQPLQQSTGGFATSSRTVLEIPRTEVVENPGVVTEVCDGIGCARTVTTATSEDAQRVDPFLVRNPSGKEYLTSLDSEDHYSGQWLSNGKQYVRHGYGIQEWADGTVYTGEWLDGQASGRGQITFADGQLYIGEWRANLAHGLGISRPTVNTSYSGSFKHGLRHGIGVEAWGQNGHGRYEGEFSFGMREGHGICVWPDGFRYIGVWHLDRIHGPGTCIDADGHVFHGKWIGGMLKEDRAIIWRDPDYKAFKSRYKVETLKLI